MTTTTAAWVAWQRSGGVPETTIGLRRYYLQRLARDHRGRDLLDLDVDDLTTWLQAHDWSPNTRKSVRSALRSFYGWARERGLVEVSPAHLLPAVRARRGRPKPTPESAYRYAVEHAPPRARLAIRLAAQCGMRRGEIAAVHVDDVEEDAAGFRLRVVGKGGHVRMVPLPDDLAVELLDSPGWVFPSPRGGHLTPAHLAKVVTAHVDGHTHQLRHRAATVAYKGTHDLRAVQELLGHASVATTQLYVAVADDAVRLAMLAAAA